MTPERSGASGEPVAAAAATPNEQLFAALYGELRRSLRDRLISLVRMDEP